MLGFVTSDERMITRVTSEGICTVNGTEVCIDGHLSNPDAKVYFLIVAEVPSDEIGPGDPAIFFLITDLSIWMPAHYNVNGCLSTDLMNRSGDVLGRLTVLDLQEIKRAIKESGLIDL